MSAARDGVGVAVFGRGRVCAASGCETRLSQYNPSAYCVIHEPLPERRPPKHSKPESRPAESRTCDNPLCECEFEATNPRRIYCSDRCRVEAFLERRRRQEEGVS